MKCTLNDVADIRGGYAFRGRIEHDPAADLAVVNIKDIDPQASVTELNLSSICSESIDKLDRYLLQPGDVLFQSRGSRNLSMYIDIPIKAIPAHGLYWARPKTDKILGAYLAWYLNHKNSQARFPHLAQATQIAAIPRQAFESFPIHVPSIAQQQKIIDIAQKRQKQKKLQQQLDALTDQIIDAACWQKAKTCEKE